MSMQHFTRNGGKYSNPWANSVEPNVKGKTHKAVNYLFCLIHPIIYFFQKLVEVVNAWGWEEYGSQIWVGEAIRFWKMCFWLMGKVSSQKLFPSHGSLMSFIFLMHLKLVGLSPSRFLLPHAVEATCVSLLHVFSYSPHFPCPENLFFCWWWNGQ